MDRFTTIYAPIVGRILVGGFFLWEGIEKALNFSSTVDLTMSTGLPQPLYIALGIVTLDVLGGIALVTGFKTSMTALILATLTVCTAFLSVNYDDQLALSLFLQNMAIVGGLFYMSAFGSGSWDPQWPYGPAKK